MPKALQTLRVPQNGRLMFRRSIFRMGDQLGRLGHKLLLAGRDLARRDAELARQLGRCPISLGGGQTHLRLEGCPTYSSLPGRHPAPDRVPPAREPPPDQGAVTWLNATSHAEDYACPAAASAGG
jgi:hypothetical protein